MNSAANNTAATITTNQGHVITSRYFDDDHRVAYFTHIGIDMVVTNAQWTRLVEGHRAEGARVA